MSGVERRGWRCITGRVGRVRPGSTRRATREEDPDRDVLFGEFIARRVRRNERRRGTRPKGYPPVAPPRHRALAPGDTWPSSAAHIGPVGAFRRRYEVRGTVLSVEVPRGAPVLSGAFTPVVAPRPPAPVRRDRWGRHRPVRLTRRGRRVILVLIVMMTCLAAVVFAFGAVAP